MIGLVDCNNFFVSCERLFNPLLEGKAVVVLSNNDGCVISRSNEAKALGIPMGLPAFKIKEYTNPNNVVSLSCRHVIYRDISDRVMSIISEEVEYLQIYSVDECFFTLPYEDDEANYYFVTNLAAKIKRYTGIPVSIGVAPSRTLAKIASHIAKKSSQEDVFLITKEDQFEPILRTISVRDVWGIGRKLSDKFMRYHVKTAYDLSKSPMSWIKSMFTVNEERIVKELNGENCAIVSAIDEPNKSIMASRSFGTLIDDKKTLWEAVAYFAACCAERLRAQNSVAIMVSVYVRGDVYKEKEPFYSNTCDIRFETPSCDTAYITQYAMKAFNNIYRDGYKYKKAGVMLTHLEPNTEIQLNVFDDIDPNKQKRLMNVLDKINGVCGKGTLILGAQGVDKKWSPRKEYTAKQSNTLRIYSGMSITDLDRKK